MKSGSGPESERSKLQSAIADFPPAYFSMVMATGIVSIASHLLDIPLVSVALFGLNIVCYIVLWIFTCARIFIYPRRFFDDLKDHFKGVGVFTIVAGSCVLGSQFVILMNAFKPATALLTVGIVSWGLLIYFIFTLFTVSAEKPSIASGINGVWLVSIVATQSISILSCLIVSHFPGFETLILFFSLCMFLVGGMLYFLIITLIFYRFMFFSLKPEALGPPYWINMGAVAISTLAGASLVLNSDKAALLQVLLPFITGVTVLFWAVATWWIPYLLLLGAWRYMIGRIKFTYDPQYWGMVFPLGMYTTCTFQLAKAIHLDFLLKIPRVFIYAAFLAWGLTFFGLLKLLVRPLFSHGNAS